MPKLTCSGKGPDVTDRYEPMQVQALVAQRSVERLDEGVIGGLSWQEGVDPDTMMIRLSSSRICRGGEVERS